MLHIFSAASVFSIIEAFKLIPNCLSWDQVESHLAKLFEDSPN